MEKVKELWLDYQRQIIVGVVLLIGLIIVGSWLLGPDRSRDRPQQFSLSSSGTVSEVVSSHRPRRVCVDVKGAVNRPGIYHLPHGARVNEALKAAGGPLASADMRQVNLAKELVDQQVVYIPIPGEQVPADFNAGATNSTTEQSSSGQPMVNLNTANKEQLCQITGIGDKKADLIIEYRQQHGQFKTVDELMQVSGFGEKTVAKIKDQLAV